MLVELDSVATECEEFKLTTVELVGLIGSQFFILNQSDERARSVAENRERRLQITKVKF
jgi:hypothetical protein